MPRQEKTRAPRRPRGSQRAERPARAPPASHSHPPSARARKPSLRPDTDRVPPLPPETTPWFRSHTPPHCAPFVTTRSPRRSFLSGSPCPGPSGRFSIQRSCPRPEPLAARLRSSPGCSCCVPCASTRGAVPTAGAARRTGRQAVSHMMRLVPRPDARWGLGRRRPPHVRRPAPWHRATERRDRGAETRVAASARGAALQAVRRGDEPQTGGWTPPRPHRPRPRPGCRSAAGRHCGGCPGARGPRPRTPGASHAPSPTSPARQPPLPR
jgi:hypothetical protein